MKSMIVEKNIKEFKTLSIQIDIESIEEAALFLLIFDKHGLCELLQSCPSRKGIMEADLAQNFKYKDRDEIYRIIYNHIHDQLK